MMTKDSIEAAYCFFHQKWNVYSRSNIDRQRDEIEYAIDSYTQQMSRELRGDSAGAAGLPARARCIPRRPRVGRRPSGGHALAFGRHRPPARKSRHRHTEKERGLHLKCNPRSLRYVIFIYFTLSTMALKASGLFTARSARTLRLISIPAL